MTTLCPRKTPRRLACVCLIAATAAGARPSGSPARDVERAARAGGIEGVVTYAERPARRVLNRYVGSGDPGARRLQDVPVVVYLEGTVPGSPGPRAGTMEVAQQDTAFAPSAVIVPVGTTVAFPNRDPFFHNVFSFSPAKRFDLGRYPRGESKSVVFDQPGAVKVYCEVHDYMRSVVIVVENPHYTIVGPDGRFSLPDVPPGRYRLVVWHVELRPRELDVTVPEEGVARVEVTLS